MFSQVFAKMTIFHQKIMLLPLFWHNPYLPAPTRNRFYRQLFGKGHSRKCGISLHTQERDVWIVACPSIAPCKKSLLIENPQFLFDLHENLGQCSKLIDLFFIFYKKIWQAKILKSFGQNFAIFENFWNFFSSNYLKMRDRPKFKNSLMSHVRFP